MQRELGERGGERTTFAQTLNTLKHTGSNLLLVGRGGGAHGTACRRLRGESRGESRYRVFVTDDARCCYHDHEAEDVTTAIVEYSGPSSSDSGVGDGSEEALCQLVTDVIDTVEEFEDEADGFEPSELRVCVDSLVPLLQQYDTEDVFRFVHVTTARIEQARGMGHYHLPVSRDHDAISLLEPMFDAVVSLRTRENVHEQQWHLRDQGTTTDWIQL
ncbi:DUF7504 family protein [Natrialba swarupiae]|uniref:Uncharacterized protein n=1 Tax=Natrialba swarupiae TaxID=2448032 RepID=A0A5D5ARA7_9EURY|nr:hypothetical protein [Natrialba swarupiae]TYT61581.1 hypothetical protein FYC77_12900 [Natrialba swarupiae]